jgi:Cu2+-exporting ATPase
MGDRLSQVMDCISLGSATLNKIKQNLAWALIYNVIGIPLAAGALLPSMGIALSPSAAGGMMAFSSVAVVSNSLLLRAQYAADADARHARLTTTVSAGTPAAAGSSS